MGYLNKCIIVIGICLNLTYAFDIFDQNQKVDAIIPQLIMLAFVNISVVTAYFSKKWFGQLLLYSNFLLVGLIPLFFGIVSIWVENTKIKASMKYACIGIPLLLLLIPIITQMAGNTENGSAFDFRIVLYRLVQAIYWYTVFMYTSLHLKQEYEKIEKKA